MMETSINMNKLLVDKNKAKKEAKFEVQLQRYIFSKQIYQIITEFRFEKDST